MALLPNFEEVAKHFVKHYYPMFDSAEGRVNLVNFYSVGFQMK